MRTWVVRRLTAGLLACAVVLASSSARAEPQATVGLTIGAAGVGLDRKIWRATDFHLGLRSDVLFGRSKTSDFGVGPYVEVLTHAFDQVQFGGGASVLIPVIDPFPIVASFGAYGRKGSDRFGLEPGIAAELFFGSRSYNFHANYVLTAGFLAEMRYGLGPSRETSIVIGAQLDLAALGLPFVFLANALRGGSGSTAPVK